jgi:hypothetical protein
MLVGQRRDNDTATGRQRIVTIYALRWIRGIRDANVMRVAADVSDLVRHTHWMDRRPQRCTRGHWLLPGHMIVDTIPCSCGEHITWECECSAITYGPALAEGCSLLDGPAQIR